MRPLVIAHLWTLEKKRGGRAKRAPPRADTRSGTLTATQQFFSYTLDKSVFLWYNSITDICGNSSPPAPRVYAVTCVHSVATVSTLYGCFFFSSRLFTGLFRTSEPQARSERQQLAAKGLPQVRPAPFLYYLIYRTVCHHYVCFESVRQSHSPPCESKVCAVS